MNDTLSLAYGPYRTPLAKIFGPIIDPRTYLRAARLLSMFPTGIAYFVGLVVMLSVGGSLVWTIVGPVVLITALYLSRWAGDAEAWVARRTTQIDLRRPPTAIDIKQSLRAQLWTRLIDRNTWTGLVYLFFQFPIGIGMFVGIVTLSAIAGAFVAAPALLAFTDVTVAFGGWFRDIDTVSESLVLVPIGLFALFVEIHLITLASAAHATWARMMLASRAKAMA